MEDLRILVCYKVSVKYWSNFDGQILMIIIIKQKNIFNSLNEYKGFQIIVMSNYLDLLMRI